MKRTKEEIIERARTVINTLDCDSNLVVVCKKDRKEYGYIAYNGDLDLLAHTILNNIADPQNPDGDRLYSMFRDIFYTLISEDNPRRSELLNMVLNEMIGDE